MTTAVAALAGEGKAQVARLSVDAQPIAALVTEMLEHVSM